MFKRVAKNMWCKNTVLGQVFSFTEIVISKCVEEKRAELNLLLEILHNLFPIYRKPKQMEHANMWNGCNALFDPSILARNLYK